MGIKGRNKMLTQFDESIVIAKYLDAIKSIVANDCSTGIMVSRNA